MPVLFDRQPPGEAEGEALRQPLGAGEPGLLGDLAAHQDVLGGVHGEQDRQRLRTSVHELTEITNA